MEQLQGEEERQLEEDRVALLSVDSLSQAHNAPPSFTTEERTPSSLELHTSSLSSFSSSSSSSSSIGPKQKSKWLLLAKILLTISILTCLVISKVSLLEIGARLYSLTNTSDLDPHIHDEDVPRIAINIYWELLLILWIPNLVTIVRCLWNGMFLGKSNLWPTPKLAQVVYIAIISVLAIIEALSESIITFVLLPGYPPEIFLFLMGGVLIWQTAHSKSENNYMYDIVRYMLAGFSFVGLIFILTFYFFFDEIETVSFKFFLAIITLISLTVSGIFWSFKLERKLFKLLDSKERRIDEERNEGESHDTYSDYFIQEKEELSQQKTRWKINLISAIIRTCVYPISCYLLFRYTYMPSLNIDPYHLSWSQSSHNTSSLISLKDAFSWDSQDIVFFTLHITTTLIAFILIKLSCITAVHNWGLVLPLSLATPVTCLIYFTSIFSRSMPSILHNTSYSYWVIALVLISIITHWVILSFIALYKLVGYNTNRILLQDADMFVRPYYISTFFEQCTLLNRAVEPRLLSSFHPTTDRVKIFICSTMYMENSIEMTQLLESIYRVANHMYMYPNESPIFESHIFFDGGVTRGVIEPFALQLLSLIPKTLKVQIEGTCACYTPYGAQMEWSVLDRLKFVIHLKDKTKVKNRKRWSQVMYMEYILSFLLAKEKESKASTYILTTDADVDFNVDSILVLLDVINSNPHIGGVCARTHPRGSGIMYWFQVFDYAVSQWFQKPSEHILGSVLCCPGCFSLFRTQAMADVLPEYSTDVITPVDFLSKDMGEDRWLTVLMIRSGWKMEYCSLSKNYTHCPQTFEDFFKQRRRWISSTITHLILFITGFRTVIKNNSKITWVFTLYQVFNLFLSAISPSTMILIIASGFEEAYYINSIIIMTVLGVTCLFYTLMCLLASDKTQFEISKIFSLLLAVVMVIVLLGLVKQSFTDIFDGIEAFRNTTHTKFPPVHYTTVYIWLFVTVYLLAGLIHLSEVWCLAYGLPYVAGLPLAQMLLTIYTAVNVASTTWGTRERGGMGAGFISEIFRMIKDKVETIFQRRRAREKESKEGSEEERESLLLTTDDSTHERGGGSRRETLIMEIQEEVKCEHEDEQDYKWITAWLEMNDAQKFLPNFIEHGYTEEMFIAGTTREDLRSIGITPEGFVRRLERSAQQLSRHSVRVGIPNDIESWLKGIRMDYKGVSRKFKEAGYSLSSDVDHLKEITELELYCDIGITKIAHRKWLWEAIKALSHETSAEDEINEVKRTLDKTLSQSSTLHSEEKIFWETLVTNEVLHPIPRNIFQEMELRHEFRLLKKNVLLGLLLINMVWMIVLYSSSLPQLRQYNINTKLLANIFLSVYGGLLLLQFINMLCHRVVTFCHYLSKLDTNGHCTNTNTDDSTCTDSTTDNRYTVHTNTAVKSDQSLLCTSGGSVEEISCSDSINGIGRLDKQ